MTGLNKRVEIDILTNRLQLLDKFVNDLIAWGFQKNDKLIEQYNYNKQVINKGEFAFIETTYVPYVPYVAAPSSPLPSPSLPSPPPAAVRVEERGVVRTQV